MTDEHPRPPVADLNPAAIGRILIQAVATASVLGHKKITGTLRDYVDDGQSPEMQFVKDAITRPVEELIPQWFGNQETADALVQRVAFGD